MGGARNVLTAQRYGRMCFGLLLMCDNSMSERRYSKLYGERKHVHLVLSTCSS